METEFRKMRRFKQEVTREECIELLEQEPRGVLAISNEGGYPYALPMNYVYERSDGKIYFHCAKEGYKLDLLAQNQRVSFCVYNQGFRKENDWALNITSVIVFGTIRKIQDQQETLQKVKKLALKYYPTPEAAEAEVEKAASRVQILELTIEHMTGKLVNES